MQTFQDTVTSKDYAFNPDVVVTEAAGVYSFTTAGGVPLAVPTTLQPFTPPPPAPPPAPTLTQQAQAAMNGGIVITSAGTPAVSGTYAIDAESRADMMGEMMSLSVNSTFTNGTTTLDYLDAGSPPAPHAFTAPLFKEFVTAVGAYVGALKFIVKTGSGTLPSASVTIA